MNGCLLYKRYSFQILDLQKRDSPSNPYTYVEFYATCTACNLVFSLCASCCLSYTIMANDVSKNIYSIIPRAITTLDIKSAPTGDNLTLFNLSNLSNPTTTEKVQYQTTTQTHFQNNSKTAPKTLTKQHEILHQATQPETLYNTLIEQPQTRTTDQQKQKRKY